MIVDYNDEERKERQELREEYDRAQEWRDDTERYSEFVDEYAQRLKDLDRRAEDRHFKEIGSNPIAILADAIEQVTHALKHELHFDVEEISTLIAHHCEKLDEEKALKAELDDYIENAIKEDIYMGDVLKGVTVVRPSKFTTPVDRISTSVFEEKMTMPADADPAAYKEVDLNPNGKREAIARAALHYGELLKADKIKEIPELNSYDYLVYAAIVSHYLAGNRVITVDMIYRAMTGKMWGKINVTEDIRERIMASIAKFDGSMRITYKGKNSKGKEIEFDYTTHLLTYDQVIAEIHGKRVAAIRIPTDPKFAPILLRWARANGNELSTHNMTLRDVPGLNNSDESMEIREYLLKRITRMKTEYNRAKKKKNGTDDVHNKILFDAVYKNIHITKPDKNKRHDVKNKIDKCLNTWVKEEWIAGYQYITKPSSNQIDAVVIFFTKKDAQKAEAKRKAEKRATKPKKKN